MSTLLAPTEPLTRTDTSSPHGTLLEDFLQRVRPGAWRAQPVLERPAAPRPMAASAAGPAPPEAAIALTAEAVRGRVAQLPPLPAAVRAVLGELDEGTASVGQVATLLQRDPALTARVLRLANSAFYGVPGRVASVHDAINLIGLRSLRSLVVTAGVTQALPRSVPAGFDTAAFWRHTVATASAARAMASAHGLDEELTYTAGLLHDVGALALAAHFPDTSDDPAPASAGTALGHAEVGAIVAAHWHLPATVVQAIACHHRPAEAVPSVLVDVVHVADALAHGLGFRHEPDRVALAVQAGPWQRVGLERLPYAELFEQVEAAVGDTCRALGL